MPKVRVEFEVDLADPNGDRQQNWLDHEDMAKYILRGVLGLPMTISGKVIKIEVTNRPKVSLSDLLRLAAQHVWTDEEKREHAISFAYGNLKIDGSTVTREEVAREYDILLRDRSL